MKKIFSTVLLVFALASLSGCLFVDVRFPMDRNFNQTSLGLKEGRSESQSFLWLFSVGDAGTKSAAKNGGVRVIKHADVEVYSLFFGLYTRISTVVYGD